MKKNLTPETVFGTQIIENHDINAARLHADQISCARASVAKGTNLKDHMAVQDRFERLDSGTYTIICKMFINANPDNVRFVNPVRYKLNKSQIDSICAVVGTRADIQIIMSKWNMGKRVK